MPKSKFISIFEKIKFPKASKIYYFCAGLIIVTLSMFNFAAYKTLNKTAYVLGASVSNDDKIIYWEEFLKSYPDYKDGWIKLAKLYYQKGDIQSAEVALEKAVEIDPNSEEIRSLKVSLGL